MSPRAPNLPAIRDRLQVQTAEGTWPVELEGRCHLDVEGRVTASSRAPGIALWREGDTLRVQAVAGAVLHLNAVQVSGPVSVQPGDELRLPGLLASLLRETLLVHGGARPDALLEPWIEAALSRAALLGGALSLTLHEGVPPEERPGQTSFSLGSGRWLMVSEGQAPLAPLERVARFPRDGRSASALLARALGASDPEEAPLASEPATLRLAKLLEALGETEGPLLIEGEAGVGRAFRAAYWLRRRGYRALRRVQGADPAASSMLGAVGLEEGLLIEDVDRLPEPVQRSLASREGSWAATAGTGAVLAPSLAVRFARARLFVPPLRDRRQELAVLVDAELLRLRQRFARPGLQLDRVAREVVLEDAWPDNLDGLRACLSRAAHVARTDWIRVEDLPVRLRASVVRLGLNDAREAAERAILLHALEQARWNVAETARRLGMPRRTLVHRMKVVGLKRPKRGG